VSCPARLLLYLHHLAFSPPCGSKISPPRGSDCGPGACFGPSQRAASLSPAGKSLWHGKRGWLGLGGSAVSCAPCRFFRLRYKANAKSGLDPRRGGFGLGKILYGTSASEKISLPVTSASTHVASLSPACHGWKNHPRSRNGVSWCRPRLTLERLIVVTRKTTPRRLVARRGSLGGQFHPSCRQQGHRVLGTTKKLGTCARGHRASAGSRPLPRSLLPRLLCAVARETRSTDDHKTVLLLNSEFPVPWWVRPRSRGVLTTILSSLKYRRVRRAWRRTDAETRCVGKFRACVKYSTLYVALDSKYWKNRLVACTIFIKTGKTGLVRFTQSHWKSVAWNSNFGNICSKYM
jgi:hypothetical protein